jgi:hypothetical protein
VQAEGAQALPQSTLIFNYRKPAKPRNVRRKQPESLVKKEANKYLKRSSPATIADMNRLSLNWTRILEDAPIATQLATTVPKNTLTASSETTMKSVREGHGLFLNHRHPLPLQMSQFQYPTPRLEIQLLW